MRTRLRIELEAEVRDAAQSLGVEEPARESGAAVLLVVIPVRTDPPGDPPEPRDAPMAISLHQPWAELVAGKA